MSRHWKHRIRLRASTSKSCLCSNRQRRCCAAVSRCSWNLLTQAAAAETRSQRTHPSCERCRALAVASRAHFYQALQTAASAVAVLPAYKPRKCSAGRAKRRNIISKVSLQATHARGEACWSAVDALCRGTAVPHVLTFKVMSLLFKCTPFRQNSFDEAFRYRCITRRSIRGLSCPPPVVFRVGLRGQWWLSHTCPSL